MRRIILALMGSTTIAMASTTGVLAQVKTPQDARPSIHRDAADNSSASQKQSDARQLSDEMFVRRATLGNMFEVQSSRLASRKAQNENVRNFAERLIDDHQAAQNELKGAAGDISFPKQLGERQSRRMDRLRQTSNDRFDWRFIGTQIRAHRSAIAMFEAFAGAKRNAANQDDAAAKNGETDRHQALVQWAQETLPTLREHLQTARQIRQDLRGAGQGVASRQNDRQRDGAGRMKSADAGRTLTIEQPAPRVSVQPRRPEVTVQQPQPKITIRQAPPTITIEQPQPEIVVQMPRPDVNIEQRRPQVTVNMPEPKLEVDRTGNQADVRVADQPDLGARQSNVQFQSAQRPQVQYQRTGEPKVVYRRAEGEPTVRYQSDQSGRQTQSDRRQQTARFDDESNRSDARQTKSGTDQRSDATQKGNDWAGRVRELAGANTGDRATTGKANDEPEPRTTTIEVGRLIEMDIYNSTGQNLGEVDQVIADQTGTRKYLVLAHGGFIGLFEDEVALPLERVVYRGDRLIVSGLTEQEIEDMPNWESRVGSGRELEDSQTVEVKLGQH